MSSQTPFLSTSLRTATSKVSKNTLTPMILFTSTNRKHSTQRLKPSHIVQASARVKMSVLQLNVIHFVPQSQKTGHSSKPSKAINYFFIQTYAYVRFRASSIDNGLIERDISIVLMIKSVYIIRVSEKSCKFVKILYCRKCRS